MPSPATNLITIGGVSRKKRHKIFADEYIIDLNGTRAYLVAYPNCKKSSASARANKLLKDDEVRCYIDEELEKMHNERTASAQEVIEYLTSVMRGKSESSVLAGCGDGCEEVIVKPPDEKERLKAAELLGKRYGIFTEKVDVNNESEEKKQQSISNIEALVQQMIPVNEDDVSD